MRWTLPVNLEVGGKEYAINFEKWFNLDYQIL